MPGVPPCLALGVIIQAGPAMREQKPGQRLPCGIVPREKAGQGDLLIVIGHNAGRGRHGGSPELGGQDPGLAGTSESTAMR